MYMTSIFIKILRPQLEEEKVMFLDDFGINYMGPEAARSGARMLAPPQSTQRPSPHDCGLIGPRALERMATCFVPIGAVLQILQP